MSGIVGYINNKEKVSSDLLDSMSESIRYTESSRIDKWNDDFAALSIVHHDIINPELQPIFNEDKSLCIVMFGEVFDYEEQKLRLVRNGHTFKFEDNDAEYCLHLYEENGENAFQELNGSFCIAIYNLVTHEFILANDRFSSHPLFYYLTDKNTLLFGTQLSSILQSYVVPRTLNMAAIFDFFTFHKVLGTRTFYEGINALPPATLLYYRNGNISSITYWEMKYKDEKHPEEYYVDALTAAIKNSVNRRTQKTERCGVLLSGGLDSRMILAASDKEMVCFTFGDFENREVKIARRIAKVKGYKHIFLKRDIDHYVNLVDKAVDIGNGMYGFVHAHSVGFFDQISKECDVLLHGYAMERFFRGTFLPRRDVKLFGKRIFTMLDKLSNRDLLYTIIYRYKTSLYYITPQQLFTKTYSSIYDESLLNSVTTILKEAERPCSSSYDKFLWLDTHYPQGFAFLFVTSIRSFINERSIIFDNDLIDLHLKMPFDFRSTSKIWMKALAKLDSKIAVIPDANTGYSPFMPEILEKGLNFTRGIANKLHLSRPSPLPHPTYSQRSWPKWAKLIKYNEKMKKLVSDTLGDPEYLDPNIFNIQRIKEMFKEYLNGKDEYTVFLFLLLTFGKWHKKYGPRKFVK